MKQRRGEVPFQFTLYAEQKIDENNFASVCNQEELDYLLDELMRNRGYAKSLVQGKLLVFEIDGETYRGYLDIKE